MNVWMLPALALLALLAACGGSQNTNESTSAAPEVAPISQASPTMQERAEPAAAATSAATSASLAPTAAGMAVTAATAPADFAVCRACHSIEAGRNGVGPSLFGIVGSKAGNLPGYTFSPALKASAIVWDRAALDIWLQGPMKMVPGTRMVITVPDAAKRKAIIDYLETLK